MPGCKQIPLPVIPNADLLARHHLGIAPVPYIHRGWFLHLFGRVFRNRNLLVPLCDAEEYNVAFEGPRWLAIRDRSHSGGEGLVCGGIVYMRDFGSTTTQMRPRERDTGGPFAFLVSLPAEGGQIRAVFPPGKS